MSKYADVYLVPILEEKIPAYKKLATAVGKIFMRSGALRYREYVGSDLDIQDVVPFPKKIKLKEGETLVYASVEFKSEAHRNKVMKAIFADPEMSSFSSAEQLFDCKRMVYGGFKILVDL